MSTFVQNVASILSEYYPSGSVTTNELEAEISKIFNTSDLGAFSTTLDYPAHDKLQINVPIAGQNIRYSIDYTYNDVRKTRTFFGSIPNGNYSSKAEAAVLLEKAFRDAYWLNPDVDLDLGANLPLKNLANMLGFNALWKVDVESGTAKIKLLIPHDVSDFIIHNLTYDPTIENNQTVGGFSVTSNDLITGVKYEWEGDLENIPTGGVEVDMNIVSLTKVNNNDKLLFRDENGGIYIGILPQKHYTYAAELALALQNALQNAFRYSTADVNLLETASSQDITVTVTWNVDTRKFDFTQGTSKITKFYPVNGSTYSNVGLVADGTKLVSGIDLSLLNVDNSTDDLVYGASGGIIIDSTNKILKYKVSYLDSDFLPASNTLTVTLAEGNYTLSALATALQTALNDASLLEGTWTVTVNTLGLTTTLNGTQGVNTNSLRIVFDAEGVADTGLLKNDNRSILRVQFLEVANSGYETLKFNTQLYESVNIKNNFVYNDGNRIKYLPDAGLVAGGTLVYDIRYFDTNDNSVHTETRTATVSTQTFVKPSDLGDQVYYALRAADENKMGWDVNWNSSQSKYIIEMKGYLEASGTIIASRTDLQIRFHRTPLSDLLGIVHTQFNTPLENEFVIETLEFNQPFITIPGGKSLKLVVNGTEVEQNLWSGTFFSGDEFAYYLTDLWQTYMIFDWKKDRLRFAYAQSSHPSDLVFFDSTSSGIDLINIGSQYFRAIDDNFSSQVLKTWVEPYYHVDEVNGVLSTTNNSFNISVRDVNDALDSMFPVTKDEIKKRFFPSIVDSTGVDKRKYLNIFELVEGIRNVVVTATNSYMQEIGKTSDFNFINQNSEAYLNDSSFITNPPANHITNELTRQVINLPIVIKQVGANLSAPHYVKVVDHRGLQRVYEIHTEYLYDNDFTGVDTDVATIRSLVTDYIKHNYNDQFFELLFRHIQVKVKEATDRIQQKWIVAVNNDASVNEYLTNGLLLDLKNQLTSKIIPEEPTTNVFNYLSDAERSTLLNALNKIIPVLPGSSYYALTELNSVSNLADPYFLWDWLINDGSGSGNLYELAADTSVSQADKTEFIREYFDRLLKAYAELVKDKLLEESAFKPDLVVALAKVVELDIGTKQQSLNGDYAEWFNSFVVSQGVDAEVKKLSNMVNAIARNLLYANNTASAEVADLTSDQLLFSVKEVTINNKFTRTRALLNGNPNNEFTPSLTRSLGDADDGGQISYLAVLMYSHHLLYKILADGPQSLFNDTNSITEARWDRLLLAYNQEGRLFGQDNFFKQVDYFTGLPSPLETLAKGLHLALLNSPPDYSLVTSSVKNMAYVRGLFEQIDIAHGGSGTLSLVGEPTTDATSLNDLLIGKAVDSSDQSRKLEGIARYYFDTIYNYLVLEKASPLYQLINNSELGKGLTHSLFYRQAMKNQYSEILTILGNFYSGEESNNKYLFDDLSVANLSLLQEILETESSDFFLGDQVYYVLSGSKRNDPFRFVDDEMRKRIFGESLAEQPTANRRVLSATPEMQAQINLMKFYESYLKRFRVIDQGLLLGLIIQQHKRILQQEANANPTGDFIGPQEYLERMFSYLSNVIEKIHVIEPDYVTLVEPFTNSPYIDTLPRSILHTETLPTDATIVEARDLIVLEHVFQIIRSPQVNQWKFDILNVINAEQLRLNLQAGSPNDISEFLEIYERSIQDIQECISKVMTDTITVDKNIKLLTAGLAGGNASRVEFIDEAVREKDALEYSKRLLDNLMIVVEILSAQLADIISKQNVLTERINAYNSLFATLSQYIADLESIYSTVPPEYCNFAELASQLAAALNLVLKKRDLLTGKISQLKVLLNNIKSVYNIQKNITIPKYDISTVMNQCNFTTLGFTLSNVHILRDFNDPDTNGP